MLDSYVLRVVRRLRDQGNLVGVVEDVQTGKQAPFTGTAELLELLSGRAQPAAASSDHIPAGVLHGDQKETDR